MNLIKKIILASLLLVVGGSLVHAANEGAGVTGFAQSELGVTRGSTETRRIRAFDDGTLSVAFGTNRSSYTDIATVGSTIAVNGVDTSSNTRNPNVLAVASSSQPVLVRLPMFGNGLAAERIRMYDTRGTTTTANCIFDKPITSTDTTSSIQWADHWVSSGLTVVKGGSGVVIWRWREMNPKLMP